MAKNREIAEYFLELCRDIPEPRIRSMFGGHGLYSGEAMFGLEAYGELYLKTDGQTREAFEAVGAAPFVYESAGGKKTVMSYFTPPVEILEDPDRLLPLVTLALESANRALSSKRAKKKTTLSESSVKKKTTGGKKKGSKKRGKS